MRDADDEAPTNIVAHVLQDVPRRSPTRDGVESPQAAKGNRTHLTTRMLALVLGVIGALCALVINIVYSTGRHINNIVFQGSATSHGFIGLLLVLAGLVGAAITPAFPIVGAVLMAIAGVGFFFIVGWWALLLASPLLLVAAFLAFSAQREATPTNPSPRQPPLYPTA